MIAIKLLLVPLLLAAVTIAGRRWGQNVAGWLGSFPIVAGPILLVLSLEQGPAFGARAAQFALAGIAATMAFFVVYARVAQHAGWGSSMLAALLVWLAAVVGLMQLPQSLPFALGAALLSLAISAPAMGAQPTQAAPPAPSMPPASARAPHPLELPARMAAGAALTVTSSALAARFGADASGYAALFPVVGATAAGFNHATAGAASARAFLRGMTRGMWSVAVFCVVLTLALARWPVATAFAAAVLATVTMHAATRPRG
jgi:hypothetical protein